MHGRLEENSQEMCNVDRERLLGSQRHATYIGSDMQRRPYETCNVYQKQRHAL